MKLLLYITSRTDLALDIAQAWQNAGAPGVTLVRGTGLYSLQQATKHASIELPRHVISMAGVMAEVLENMGHTTELALAIVSPELVDDLIQATSSIAGDLTQPGHGVFIVVDIERAIGVRNHGETGS